MILKNIKANQKDRGFTIVELLVVIVVIGILAAITIVSYTGITTRANTNANKQNASSVLSALQTYFADNSAWPATSGTSEDVYTAINANNTAKLPSGLTITNAQLTAGSNIQYTLKSTTGVCVGYWDYSANTGAGGAVYMYGGDAATGTNATPPTCA